MELTIPAESQASMHACSRRGQIDVNHLLVLVLGLVIGWLLFTVCRPRPVFVVRIRDGVPRAVRGQVTRGFLQDVAETCARHGVRDGEVRGLAAGRRIGLTFSGGIPNRCRQQIRNLWGVSGWSAMGPSKPSRMA
jgi:hypothetical protein